MRLFPAELLVDSSVLVACFRRDAGALQPAADHLYDEFVDGDTSLLLLDLAVYEFANVLVRRHRVPGDEAASLLGDLFALADHVIRIDAGLAGATAAIAARTGLSDYDAAFVAGAERVAAPLVSMDERVVAAGAIHLAEFTPGS